MGISTAPPWGETSEGQCVVEGLEGDPPRAGDKLASLWAQSG